MDKSNDTGSDYQPEEFHSQGSSHLLFELKTYVKFIYTCICYRCNHGD